MLPRNMWLGLVSKFVHHSFESDYLLLLLEITQHICSGKSYVTLIIGVFVDIYL